MMISYDIINKVDNMSEVEYYLYIKKIDEHIGLLKSDLERSDCNCVREDLDNFQGVYDYVLSRLDKFGVTNNIQRDKWLKFWNDWGDEITTDIWNELRTKLRNGIDISEYLPKGRWDDCRCNKKSNGVPEIIKKNSLKDRMRICVSGGIIFKLTDIIKGEKKLSDICISELLSEYLLVNEKTL